MQKNNYLCPGCLPLPELLHTIIPEGRRQANPESDHEKVQNEEEIFNCSHGSKKLIDMLSSVSQGLLLVFKAYDPLTGSKKADSWQDVAIKSHHITTA